MATFKQPKTLSHLLLVEVAPGWTKEQVTAVGSQPYKLGQLVGKKTNSDKYEPITWPASVMPSAIVAEDADASSAETALLVIARGAVVNSDALVWPEGMDANAKAEAIKNLEKTLIITRKAK